MRQGTTPIVSLDVDKKFDYSNVYVTLDQDGTQITKASRQSDDIEIIEHFDESTGEFISSTVSLYLSQKETLQLDVGKARVQIGWVDYLGNADKTDIGFVNITESLLQEVMTYGE